MTYRRMISYGLTAGLRRDEIDRTRPGEILDLYAYRQANDLITRGIRTR